jgi:5'(3')-deoxyribonucleotidase
MYTIYCDLDGVLVDFEKGYEELTGINIKQYVKGDASFWAHVDEEGPRFWANLEWMPDGHVLWDYIKKYKPNILSSPSRSGTSKVGKEAWVKMHLQNSYNKLYLYPRANKQLFSGPNRILIDDLPNTISEWDKKGGIGILHTSAANTISELKKLKL